VVKKPSGASKANSSGAGSTRSSTKGRHHKFLLAPMAAGGDLIDILRKAGIFALPPQTACEAGIFLEEEPARVGGNQPIPGAEALEDALDPQELQSVMFGKDVRQPEQLVHGLFPLNRVRVLLRTAEIRRRQHLIPGGRMKVSSSRGAL